VVDVDLVVVDVVEVMVDVVVIVDVVVVTVVVVVLAVPVVEPIRMTIPFAWTDPRLTREIGQFIAAVTSDLVGVDVRDRKASIIAAKASTEQSFRCRSRMVSVPRMCTA
jgi:hypothetical protein